MGGAFYVGACVPVYTNNSSQADMFHRCEFSGKNLTGCWLSKILDTGFYFLVHILDDLYFLKVTLLVRFIFKLSNKITEDSIISFYLLNKRAVNHRWPGELEEAFYLSPLFYYTFPYYSK